MSSGPEAPGDEGNDGACRRPLRFIDIGINLTDPIYQGLYHGIQRHPDDLQDVVKRAQAVGCQYLLVTGSDLESSSKSVTLAQSYPGIVFSTAGIHPCSSSVFGTSTGGDGHSHDYPNPERPLSEDVEPCLIKTKEIISELAQFLTTARATQPGSIVAFGEFGLDYDRLHYCSQRVQLHSFKAQLGLAASLTPQLPLFLHSRAAHHDFLSLLKAAFGEKLDRLKAGAVVHSFTGSMEELKELIDLGLYIGINGCSLKTAANCKVVEAVPLDLIMLETDGPWCEIRQSHEGWKRLQASPLCQATNAEHPPLVTRYKSVKKERWQQGALVKGRNEPCMIENVARIVAAIKGVRVEVVTEAAWANAIQVFGL